MELTVDQALQEGIAAHKEGKLQDAERLYRVILEAQPSHPDANHNLGVLAVAVGKPLEAIPLFKLALEANPQIEQFWLSYIEALIAAQWFADASQTLANGEQAGVSAEKLGVLRQRLQRMPSAGAKPSHYQVSSLLRHYQAREYKKAEVLALSLTQQFPSHPFGWKLLGAVIKKTGRLNEALLPMQKSLELSPRDAEAHYNLGVTLKALGRLDEAEAIYRHAIALQPDYAEAHNNLGVTLTIMGRLDEAEANLGQAIALKPDYVEAHSNLANTLQLLGRLDEAEKSHRQAIVLRPDYAKAYSNLGVTLKKLGRLAEAEASHTQAIALNPDSAEAHSNLGTTLQELGRVDEAERSFQLATELNPNYATAFWNLHGTQRTIQGAEYWIDKCLEVDEAHIKARLTKAALRFYQSDEENFDELMRSEFRLHPYMRSFSWVFSLPTLPELHFDKWCFFDAIIKRSSAAKPFYEFGVWRASSFKYLIKFFKKGYGFDTFTGLPEAWDTGSHVEEKGTYTSDGNVPKIKGGEFIAGKFEDTLPAFFSESRRIASIINFDADLYSSTICALNFSKSVMDEDTVLIFDEFLMNESWEYDEAKALDEFCASNHCSYDVIAISFFTKQVAVKLIGI